VGYLKGHFQSLKGLRQQIKNEIDHLRAVEWIRACIVIHTLIHEIEYGNEDSDWEEEILAAGLSSDESSSSDDNHHGHGVAEVRRESAGQRKRRRVKENLFRSDILFE
jgi:hypothetical protein